MNTTQLRAAIEDNFLNGNLSDAKQLYRQMNFEDRKKFTQNAVWHTGNMLPGKARENQYELTIFLIDNI